MSDGYAAAARLPVKLRRPTQSIGNHCQWTSLRAAVTADGVEIWPVAGQRANKVGPLRPTSGCAYWLNGGGRELSISPGWTGGLLHVSWRQLASATGSPETCSRWIDQKDRRLDQQRGVCRAPRPPRRPSLSAVHRPPHAPLLSVHPL